MPRLTRFAALPLAFALALPAPVSGQEARGLAGAYLAARQASAANDFEAAARYYTRAMMRDSRNPELLENAIFAHLALGQTMRAVPVARQLRATGAESQIANLVLMADQMEREDWSALLADLDAGMTVGPLVDGLVRAWAELGDGDVGAAEAAFDALSEAQGLAPFASYHKALARASVGDFEGADALFSGEEQGPLRLTRRGAVAHAQVMSQLGRNDDALELMAAGFGQDLDPGLSALRAALEGGTPVPFTLIRSAKDGAAEVFYTVSRALSGEASDAYTLLYARTAQTLRPDHTDAILQSAGLLEDLEQYELATEAYDEVPREDPVFHIAELGRAEALYLSGREEAAIEVLEQLAESHGTQSSVHITRGDMLRRMERFTEATEAYNAAIALFDADREEQWVVYFTRGITQERTDKWPAAEADFRKALELNPGQPSVLNYLGYSYVELQENLDEALSMIEEAAAARPDSGHIVDSLGWVLYRLGRYDEAVVHMERAAELLPVDPIINDHLGDVYWAVGRKVEARFQWHRALSFDPEPDEAERIRRKLEVGLDIVLEEEGAPPLQVAGDEG